MKWDFDWLSGGASLLPSCFVFFVSNNFTCAPQLAALCSSSSSSTISILQHPISPPQYWLPYFPPHSPSLLSASPSPTPLYPCLHMLCLGLFTWLQERKAERQSLNYAFSSGGFTDPGGTRQMLALQINSFLSPLPLYLLYPCLFYCFFVFFYVSSYLLIVGIITVFKIQGL